MIVSGGLVNREGMEYNDGVKATQTHQAFYL